MDNRLIETILEARNRIEMIKRERPLTQEEENKQDEYDAMLRKIAQGDKK